MQDHPGCIDHAVQAGTRPIEGRAGNLCEQGGEIGREGLCPLVKDGQESLPAFLQGFTDRFDD